MKILFVCTGNTCRSNMAEAIFNKLCNVDSLQATSAGLSIVPFSLASKHTVKILRDNYGVDLSNRQAVQLTKEMLTEADLVLTMTAYMKDIIIKNFPEINGKVHSLRGFVGNSGDIVDPFGGNVDVYSQTFEMLTQDILSLIEILKKRY
ncbi:low molecular weight protein arginine phosphatase [Clostridium tunisiense]|uniref:low molecular weight protein arginine phosphatase n=1 Tax=Clostridium tunisiense TaxID=219748 RepID=UPI0002DEB913|nr:low molecular weight protein arginine phosphatase [Clostridium tunisiense]